MSYVKMPNLPQNPVKSLIIGEKYTEILRPALNRLEIKTIDMPINPEVDIRLSSHADLSALHLGSNKLILAKFLENSMFHVKQFCEDLEIIYSEKSQNPKYPNDANLNICVCGKTVFLNPKTADAKALDELCRADYSIAEVRQGYAKCAVCVVDESSIITADGGIAAAAKAAGLDVLIVKPGLAALQGFSQGFIGGAAFKLSAKKLAFTGLIPYSPEQERIETFLTDKGISPVYLTKLPLFDIGGAIPLSE